MSIYKILFEAKNNENYPFFFFFFFFFAIIIFRSGAMNILGNMDDSANCLKI